MLKSKYVVCAITTDSNCDPFPCMRRGKNSNHITYSGGLKALVGAVNNFNNIPIFSQYRKCVTYCPI